MIRWPWKKRHEAATCSYFERTNENGDYLYATIAHRSDVAVSIPGWALVASVEEGRARMAEEDQ